MKSLVVISLTLLASFFMAACAPAIDAQSAIETGIAATAQISRLETAAAGNTEQTEEPSNQTAQTGYLVSFNGSFDKHVPANTQLVFVLTWVAKTPELASEFASVTQFDLVLDGVQTNNLQGYWSEVTNYTDFDGDGSAISMATESAITWWNGSIPLGNSVRGPIR